MHTLQLAFVLLDPAPRKIDTRPFMWPGLDILLRYRVHEVLLHQSVHDEEVAMEEDGLDFGDRPAVGAPRENEMILMQSVAPWNMSSLSECQATESHLSL